MNSQQPKLLQTKFFKPRLTWDYIPRIDVLGKLNIGREFPLILVSAPAGYGKSTLVAGWLEFAKVNFSWLSLSEYDDDPLVFIRYFPESITHKLPGFADEVRQILQASEQPAVDIFTNQIINELASLKQHFYLVLDDYQYSIISVNKINN